jgi:hypothetical protein
MFRRFQPVLAMILALAPALVFGQSATGVVAGVVRDSSGGAIPGDWRSPTSCALDP